LTFCKNCNKVLKNNFSDWKKANPNKSFDDFKQLLCTTNTSEKSNENSKTKKSRGLKYWVGFTIALALFYVIGQFGGDKITSYFRKPSIDKNLMEIASELNKTCPVMVDSLTRLDNTVALPNKVFQYKLKSEEELVYVRSDKSMDFNSSSVGNILRMDKATISAFVCVGVPSFCNA